MAKDIEQLKADINSVRFNPAAMQRLSLDLLEQVNNGELDTVDPTNPFIFLLEASAVNSSASMEENANLNRRQYASLSQTEEELYLHMSDRDFVGRFASPARTNFTLLFNKSELMNRAVDTGQNDVSKLVIPRNTEFNVSDYTFTMEYPIELRVTAYGGIQVVYDVSEPSPLQTLESNIVDWNIRRQGEEEYIHLEVPVNQFKVKSQIAHITRSTNYSTNLKIEDQFYYCRVFKATGVDQWEEIRTTHTEQVYDPNTPTAVIQVFEKRVNVTIPQVYINNNSLDSELRIDVYTTKGPLNLILESYSVNAFTANWRDLGVDQSPFSAPLDTFTSMAVWSDAVVSGGTNGLSFEELRQQVVTNASGGQQLPITDAQFDTRLASAGYQAIRDVDNVTNRIFLACRRLPTPTTQATISGAAALIGTVQGSFEDLTIFDGVIDNGDQVTIKPSALFDRSNGVTRFVSNQTKDEINDLSGQNLITRVNNENLVITPFHYVLDASNQYFEERAYYLDSPSIESREFIEENTALGLSITTQSIRVIKDEDRYRVQVQTLSGDLVKERPDEDIAVQITFRAHQERRDAFLNGRQIQTVDGERIFEFVIDTRFSITDEHYLGIEGFTLYPDNTTTLGSSLVQDFNLIYYVIDSDIAERGQRLSYSGVFQAIDANAVELTHEKFSVKFGQYLDGMWERARSISSSQSYRRYESNVPALYTETVYERDSDTGSIKVSLDDDNELVYSVIHQKGDPVLDEAGNPVYQHREGDVVLDNDGNPVIQTPRRILRDFDMFLFDAKYRFADRTVDTAYLSELPKTLVGWLNTDMVQFQKWALERTLIYLFPLRTMGTAEVIAEDDLTTQINLEQSIDVTFYLDRESYNDDYVRQTLTTLTKETLAEAFRQTRIAINDIVSKLTARAGDDAVAIDVNGLGGDANIQALTLTRDSERCAVGKVLDVALDGQIEVVDDINITFLRHER